MASSFLDVRHVDMVYEKLLGLAASLHGALEAQSRIRAAELVVAHHHVLHAARELAAYHEASMGVVDGVVLDVDVLARAIFHALGSRSCFHADAVVSSVHYVIDDEHVLAAADVYGVAILCVPRTLHRDAVNDDVIAAGGYQVEFGGVE